MKTYCTRFFAFFVLGSLAQSPTQAQVRCHSGGIQSTEEACRQQDAKLGISCASGGVQPTPEGCMSQDRRLGVPCRSGGRRPSIRECIDQDIAKNRGIVPNSAPQSQSGNRGCPPEMYHDGRACRCPDGTTTNGSRCSRMGIQAATVRKPLQGPMSLSNEGGFFDEKYNNGIPNQAGWRQHLGTDYRASGDTMVYATRSGKVVENEKRSDPYDARLIVEHDDGSRGVYGHVISNLRVGDTVQSGDSIAIVMKSDSQFRFSSHLHYGENRYGRVGFGRNLTNWGWGRAPYSITKSEAMQNGWINVEENYHFSN